MASQTSPMVTRKSVTGFVTKLVGDGATYGFINDEIFFQQTNVTDGPAGSGDRVFAECEYSEHLPIKWNATSIKIIARSGQQQVPASTILESDPRRQSRQAAGLLNQAAQAQQPVHQAPPPQVAAQAQPQIQQLQPQQPPISVANTYQQHRQQRQQQQQHETGINHPPPQSHMQQQQPQPTIPMGLLDQGAMNQPPPDFFSPFAQAPIQHQPEMQAFQHDTPMGPPKLEYTSQLGSAFVQNQFMPSPLLPQQPPPQTMLPQLQAQQPQHQQQQQHQNQHQHQNQRQQQQQQHQSNQRDQRSSRDNNRDNKQVNAGRFNDKNDRNQSNRGGKNRNDNNNKFEQQQSRRSSERDNSSNSRSSRSSATRDRSGGRNDSSARGGKRDDSSNRTNNSRQSPVTTNSSKAANNVSSSDRSHKSSSSSRRSYDSLNIPRVQIMTNMNGCNMRARCSSSVHVPSDLKSVIVNKFLRLDIKNTPKPLLYKIEEQAVQASEETKAATADAGSSSANLAPAKVVAGEVATADADNSQTNIDDKSSVKSSDQGATITPPSSKSDTKLSNKYGVKVVLISLPELEAIYKKVFGPQLDAYTNESKSHARLDEAISLLCNKSTNGGHSLIGGKFDAVLDGFVEGEVNEFERYGRQPDLIATCKRVVKDQTGLDLGNCQGWTLISTFLYNNKSDYFSSKASIEYSFIYLPHIWSIMPDNLDDSLNTEKKEESHQVHNVAPPAASLNQSVNSEADSAQDVTMTEENDEKLLLSSSSSTATGAAVVEVKVEEVKTEPSSGEKPQEVGELVEEKPPVATSTPPAPHVTAAVPITTAAQINCLTIGNIADLKVADLKLELDKRAIKYKPNAKKAELVLALQQSIASPAADVVKTEAQEPSAVVEPPVPSVETPQAEKANEPAHGSVVNDQLEEGEVIADDDTNTEDTTLDEAEPSSAKSTTDDTGATSDTQSSNKRKCEEEDGAGHQETKKVCTKDKGDEKVSLIKEPFKVRARPGQLQLSTVSLYDALQVNRYDQFELSVTSFILRESLVQHLSEYIFTTLVEDSRQRAKDSSDTASTSSSITNSQDTNNSDTNNNSTSNNNKSSTTTTNNQDKSSSSCAFVKEYPVDRYINLAFAYFDLTHVGYVQADDIFKLFNNSGYTISKRALWSLIGESDKFNYRTLPDLSPKFPATHVYRFPEQFNSLPGLSSSSSASSGEKQQQQQQNGESMANHASKMIEYQGVKYNLEKLIQQVKDAETTRVNMVERFNHAIENSDKQAEEIHVLEVSRMSLSKSIASLNKELTELKHERDSIDKRHEILRKGIKGAASSLNELISKDEKMAGQSTK